MTTDRPIFVVGFQRSGTTLLQSLLGAHPAIAAPPEMYFVLRIWKLADWYGDLSDDDALRRALHDTLHAPNDALAECGFDEESLFETMRTGNRSYAALLDAVMSDFTQRHGKARWSEKSPGQRAVDVFSLFPTAQVVHIVRDPRDVVSSSRETPWTTSGAHRLATAWRAFTSSNIHAGRAAGPTRFLQVHYEDLTAEPEATLRLVCTFLGEEFAPEMLSDVARRRPTLAPAAAPWQARALEEISTSSQGTWRARLSRVDRLQVAGVVAAYLEPLGYAPARPRSVRLGRAMNSVLAARRILRKRPPVDARSRYERTQALVARSAAATDITGTS